MITVNDKGYSYALNYLEGQMDKMVKNAGRETIIQNVERDRADVRYARVPDAGACDFCKMLGSRGFIYYSKSSAGQFREWHPNCNCQVIPAFNVGFDRSNEYIDWRTTRSGKGYTQRQVSPRGVSVEAVRTRQEEINRVTKKYKEQYENGEISQTEYDLRVKSAKQAQLKYNPEALYEEYKSWGKTFKVSSRRAKKLTKNQATKASMEALADEYLTLLNEAKSTQELNQVWVRVCASTNKEELAMYQYDELRLAYRASKYAQFKQSIPS